jgi:hypothetical protein
VAFLYNKFTRKISLTLILIWGLISFVLMNPSHANQILIIIFGLINLYLAWSESAPIVSLISISFLSSYAFYGFLFQFGLPNWLVMLGMLLIFGYLFVYTEQKIGILGNQRLIYLFLFSLIILEIFLGLAYFLINPLSKSLVIALICYIFIGFCYVVLAKQDEVKLRTYLTIAIISIILIFASSRWSGGV